MANDFSQQHDAFVSKIVADPKQHVDTTLLQGYLGSSSEADSTRIYFDPSLNQYIDVKNEDIAHTEPLPKELSTLGGSYVWLRADADVLTGKAGSQRKKSKFLEGSLQAEYAAEAAARPPIQTRNPDVCGYRTPELPCKPTMYPCYTPAFRCGVYTSVPGCYEAAAAEPEKFAPTTKGVQCGYTPEIPCPVTHYPCYQTPACPTRLSCTHHIPCYGQAAEPAQTSLPELCQGAQPQYYQPPYQTLHYQHCPTALCTKVLPICYHPTPHPVCHYPQQVPYEAAGVQGQAAYPLPITTYLHCPSVYHLCPPPHTLAGIQCLHTFHYHCPTTICPAPQTIACTIPVATAACTPGFGNPGGGQV